MTEPGPGTAASLAPEWHRFFDALGFDGWMDLPHTKARIDRRVRGQQSPRPLTHDLIASAIDQLGGDFQDVYISELREHTYYAKLRIRKDGELVEVDCRPSDAIALAVTAKVPIYVAEDVLEEAMKEQ